MISKTCFKTKPSKIILKINTFVHKFTIKILKRLHTVQVFYSLFDERRIFKLKYI